MPPVLHSQIEAHEIHRGNRLHVRQSLALALRTIQVLKLGEIPEEMIEHYDRWRRYLSPPPQCRHGTDVEGNCLRFPALVIQPTRLSDRLI
ncbi:hypothetical protein TNCV_2127441 [Trichonephila clavipes]|nr:hypothetical protein TNCV_2127441 [Trichonephila clavipes]